MSNESIDGEYLVVDNRSEGKLLVQFSVGMHVSCSISERKVDFAGVGILGLQSQSAHETANRPEHYVACMRSVLYYLLNQNFFLLHVNLFIALDKNYQLPYR